MNRDDQQARIWLYPVLLLGGVALAWFLALLGVDYLLFYRGEAPFLEALTAMSAEEAQQALGNMPEVVVAILGIAITVVSIILQLSATRYTPRVTEMFFRDRTNLMVMGFFVVASISCIWATVVIRHSFIPQAIVSATILTMTAATLILIPYFTHVFSFLDPERIVARLQEQCLDVALVRTPAASSEGQQARVLAGIEQLADVAVNSISQKDRIIASRSVDALENLCVRYMEQKHALGSLWFEIGPLLRRNPDFVAMASRSVDELSGARTWLEWKVLRQYQTIYNESLNKMRDISQLVAIDTRYIGEKSIALDDLLVLELTVKFFNTYLRSTINVRDVRTGYNVLHQYRLMGEAMLRRGRNDQVLEVAKHFKYYGQTANACGLAFISETAAYDLCTICELAHLERFPLERELLATFLEVDKVPETEAQEQSLRGVRKAQIKLATFYLVEGAEAMARLIWQDMEHERRERLLSIKQEMLEVENKDFWEVIDRGHNFDYLEPRQREMLLVFYSWFPDLTSEDTPA